MNVQRRTGDAEKLHCWSTAVLHALQWPFWNLRSLLSFLPSPSLPFSSFLFPSPFQIFGKKRKKWKNFHWSDSFWNQNILDPYQFRQRMLHKRSMGAVRGVPPRLIQTEHTARAVSRASVSGRRHDMLWEFHGLMHCRVWNMAGEIHSIYENKDIKQLKYSSSETVWWHTRIEVFGFQLSILSTNSFSCKKQF